MDITMRKAGRDDMDFLLGLRLEVVRAANKLEEDADLSAVERSTRLYYEQNLGGGSHVEFLAFAGSAFAGCGAASIYRVMPTCHNPSGKKAYIMNMYTRKAYRHNGIASSILKELLAEIGSRGITHIHLEATDDGRPLYEQFGFREAAAEMALCQRDPRPTAE